MRIKDLPKYNKVELHWGDFHDIINTKTRRCVATLWTLEEARKEKDYFREYVGLDLDSVKLLPFREGRGGFKFLAKKAKDGILDVVADVDKFNRRIFNEITAAVLR